MTENTDQQNLRILVRQSVFCRDDNCTDLGIVQDALRDLELIRAAGIEGLEPAFELLEGYIGGDDPYRPTCPDLPAPGK